MFGHKKAPKTRWQQKQELAAPSRYYGDGGTIHGSGTIDVVLVDGIVTEVWFRCQQLAFRASHRTSRTLDPIVVEQGARLTGVEVLDV